MRLASVPILLVALTAGLAGEEVTRPGLDASTSEIAPQSAASSTGYPPPGTVVVVHAILSDNGDEDGWADTSETVEMRLTVYNRMGGDLTGLVARLSTDDPKIACITDPIVEIGDLGTRETRTTTEAFTFLVADMNRASTAEDFSVTFEVAISAVQFAALPEPQTVTLDLDLDAASGSEPTTYFESFETGFGSFTTMHIDEPLNPPDSDLSNHELGLQNADG